MKMKTSITVLLLWATIGVCQNLDEPECFVPGECDNSVSIHIQSSVDELECLDFCKDEELCQWFTFFPTRQTCILFENCTALDPEVCPDCLSGQRECELAEPMCWIAGECDGTLIDSKLIEVQEECLRVCRSHSECKWFTFFQPGKVCFLFSDCETFDETSLGCISGEKRCKEELTTTTMSSPATTTTSQTTTASPTPVYSKVLVALGYDGGAIADVEIIDLLSSETTCQKPQNFPYANYFASGGLEFQDKPLICGGYFNRSACHLYEDGVWKSSDSLKLGRYGFAMTKYPFQEGSSKLFLTGGYDGSSYLNSSEVLTENGWQVSVPLPVTLSYHCMVKVNSTSVMVIGGVQNGKYSGRSFLFNSETNIWTEGPTLNIARDLHSCGSIRKNSQTEEKSLIAVGGYYGSTDLSSVEVLDLDSNAWRGGPKLPFGICCAAMVEDPSGGVVLIGGYNGVTRLDTLYRLPHAGSDATWELMTQKLKTRRDSHTAFLIPDDIAACN